MSASNFDACTTTYSIKKPTTNPAISFAGGIADAYSSGTALGGLVSPKLKFPLIVPSVFTNDDSDALVALPSLILLLLKTLLLSFVVAMEREEETAQRQGTQTSVIVSSLSLSLSLSRVRVYV
jgi:hypothetical protein